MFERSINKLFLEWKDRKKRKPLVIRGARQGRDRVAALYKFCKAWEKDTG